MTTFPSLLPSLSMKKAWARGHNGIVSTMSRRIPMIPVTCWFSPIAERKRNGAMKKIIVFGYDKSFKKSYRSHVNLSWIKVLVVVSLTDTVSHYLHTTNPDIGGSLVSDLINHRVFVDLGFLSEKIMSEYLHLIIRCLFSAEVEGIFSGRGYGEQHFSPWFFFCDVFLIVNHTFENRMIQLHKFPAHIISRIFILIFSYFTILILSTLKSLYSIFFKDFD